MRLVAACNHTLATDRYQTWWMRCQGVVESQIAARKDATIMMYDTGGRPVARYHLENAWPSKLEIAGLKSDSNEVAIEGITLCHEGFEIQ